MQEDRVVRYFQSPNYGYRTRQPIGIVDHVVDGKDGSLKAAREWFLNPASRVSAHYGVGRDGSIEKYVTTSRVAWHAGIVNAPTARIYFDQGEANPNEYTIGIEHEGHPEDGLTDEQYASTLWLHRRLLEAFPGIRADRYHVIGHYELDSVNRAHCPGPHFPWDRLMNDLANLKGEF